MQALKYIPGSNGSLNASVATVTVLRSAGATTNTVNTVSGFSTFFYGTMGTPHTFTDPVTGETITVISDATAVDAAFTINAGKIDIVAIAPGQTDLGSKVGDIIIQRPNTEWANNLFNVMSAAHNDDGTLKNTSLDAFYKPGEASPANFIASGGTVAVVSGLTVSISDLVHYYAGLRYTKTSIANQVLSASKDTYIDVSTAGVVTLVAVANDATTGMALTANSNRIAKVVTDGTGVIRIDQTGYDPLGNTIYNPYPVIPPMVQDTGVLTFSGNAWQYIKMRPGYKRVEIVAHYLGSASDSTAGPSIKIGFKKGTTLAAPTGSPSASHYVNETYISNTNAVGRDLGAVQDFFAQAYNNVSAAVVHSTLRAWVDKNNSMQFGASMVAQTYEQMIGMAANNFGTDWLQLGWLGVCANKAASVTYTISYYR